MDELTDLDRRILAFERGWWKRLGARDQAILETFGMSSYCYDQHLNVLLDRPDALAADPSLVMQRRRARDLKRARRTSGYRTG